MANEIKYIPDGPKNLAALFPAVDWSLVEEYYIKVVNADNNTIATTPRNFIGCCCSDDKVRIVFLNYLGTYDAVNFMKPDVDHETAGAEYQTTLPNVRAISDRGINRSNVSSNDTCTVLANCYGEAQMLWLQELADSPEAFIEWTGKQGQADGYLPIVITSKKFKKTKNANDFRYDFIIEYKLANAYQTIRG